MTCSSIETARHLWWALTSYLNDTVVVDSTLLYLILLLFIADYTCKNEWLNSKGMSNVPRLFRP